MTRREFDAATKRNWGGPWMASDERALYRGDRLLPDRLERDPDLLARRDRYARCHGVPALSRGSRFCAPALYAARRVIEEKATSGVDSPLTLSYPLIRL